MAFSERKGMNSSGKRGSKGFEDSRLSCSSKCNEMSLPKMSGLIHSHSMPKTKDKSLGKDVNSTLIAEANLYLKHIHFVKYTSVKLENL